MSQPTRRPALAARRRWPSTTSCRTPPAAPAAPDEGNMHPPRARGRGRCDDVPGRRRQPGMKIVRHIETLDETLYGGHAEMVFDNCDVPDDAVLGEDDEGFRYAQ